jgi:hypothetical protein
MAARDGKVSRLDVISIAIASLSLAVSAVAGVVSYKAWTRPAPADPTYIPTFGQSGKPETIDAGEGGRRFFAFLDRYPGRKIRIIARVDDSQVTIQPKENEEIRSTYFYIHRKCPTGQECLTEYDALDIRGTDKDEKRGLVSSSGEWILEGYFANYGLVVERNNASERAITAMDIVTAVS